MPRFVLLRHECPPNFSRPSHWDLMLEWQGVLRTWELQTLPSDWADIFGETSQELSVDAVPLADHRIEYLTYEGPLTDDRGTVERCDHGTFEILGESPDLLVLQLKGDELVGPCRLERDEHTWTLNQNEK